MADESRTRRANGGAPPWQQDEGAGESFGSWLRKHREGRDITLQQIAEHTKINESILRAIEDDRASALPAPVFVRGFLRQYAHFVGLDAEQVVSVYPGGHTDPLRVPVLESSEADDAKGRWAWAAVAVLLIAAAAGYWFYGRSAASEDGVPSIPVTGGPVAADSSANNGDLQAGSTEAETRDGPTVEGSEGAEEAIVEMVGPQNRPGETGDPAPQLAPATPFRVTIDFVEDCWVESTVDGTRHISTLYAKGESLRLEADEHVRVFLGNYTGAVVHVNGHPYTWPQGTPGDATRELNIDAEFLAEIGAGGQPDTAGEGDATPVA